jgi:hypothetical protein
MRRSAHDFMNNGRHKICNPYSSQAPGFGGRQQNDLRRNSADLQFILYHEDNK